MCVASFGRSGRCRVASLGNKIDMSNERDVTFEEASRFAEENGLIYIEASAKTGENVEDAFLKTAKMIMKSIDDGTIDLNAADTGIQTRAPASKAATLSAPANKNGCAC